MQFKLKTISKNGIAEALDKAHLYRCLGEPEEAESICHDVLAADAENQLALRMLGLAITDQFTGHSSDRYAEAERIFQQLADPYERSYYTGIFHERRAKAQMRDGRTSEVLAHMFQEAMRHFEAAERVHPPANDDAVLRWNRCVRLIESLPEAEQREAGFEDHDSAPVQAPVRRRTA